MKTQIYMVEIVTTYSRHTAMINHYDDKDKAYNEYNNARKSKSTFSCKLCKVSGNRIEEIIAEHSEKPKTKNVLNLPHKNAFR